ncbi:MAG: hypothetical protein PHW96_00180 [Candidatus Nanoarchaeia archaeon]|nr:hypothetical protein [Candidatus Nanoarchaeia archaeon]
MEMGSVQKYAVAVYVSSDIYAPYIKDFSDLVKKQNPHNYLHSECFDVLTFEVDANDSKIMLSVLGVIKPIFGDFLKKKDLIIEETTTSSFEELLEEIKTKALQIIKKC